MNLVRPSETRYSQRAFPSSEAERDGSATSGRDAGVSRLMNVINASSEIRSQLLRARRVRAYRVWVKEDHVRFGRIIHSRLGLLLAPCARMHSNQRTSARRHMETRRLEPFPRPRGLGYVERPQHRALRRSAWRRPTTPKVAAELSAEGDRSVTLGDDGHPCSQASDSDDPDFMIAVADLADRTRRSFADQGKHNPQG